MSIEQSFAKRPDLAAKFKALIAKGIEELQAARDVILEEFKNIQVKAEALKSKLGE